MFQKVLVALDRSANGRRIFAQALGLAKSLGAELTLLHVLSMVENDIPPSSPRPSLPEWDVLGKDDFDLYFQQWDRLHQEALQWLQNLADEALRVGVPCAVIQRHGSPGRIICELAQAYDLVILGRRGRSGLGEFLLGSVSNYVLHQCPCAVWAIQGVQQDLTLPPRILVALDRPAGQRVMEEMIPLAKALKAKLNLVHILSGEETDSPSLPIAPISEVYGYPEESLKLYQEEWRAYEKQGLDLLTTYAAHGVAHGLAVETTQVLAMPGPGICEQAKSWKADMIVMGRRGLGNLEEFFLGSVSNYVVHHSPCSVLVINLPALVTPELNAEPLAEITP